ncbi:MAG: hypothetical protein VW405_01465, partial [Rhodospirillaceae bacterium]
MFDIGQQPPQFDSVSQQLLAVTALGALAMTPTLGPAVGLSTNALKNVPMFAKLVPYAGKNITLRVADRVAGEIVKRGLAEAMQVAGKTIAIIAGAAIVAGIGIDIVSANANQEDKIHSMLDQATRPVNLKQLLRDDRGKEELVSNWGLMAEAPVPPSKAAELKIKAALQAANYSGPAQIAPTKVVNLNVNVMKNVKWTAVPGLGNDIAVTLDGTAWLVTKRKKAGGFAIVRRQGNAWTEVAAGGLRIATQGAAPMVVDDKGDVLVLNSGKWAPVKVPAKAVEVAAFPPFTAIISTRKVAGGGEVHAFPAPQWKRLSGMGAVRIAVQAPGTVWVFNDKDEVYARNPQAPQWTKVPGPKASDIGASGKQVWIVAETGGKPSVHRRVNNAWE